MTALDLRLDDDGDLDLSTGDLSLVFEDAEGIAQRLQTRLRLYLGEWLLDTAAGVPWRERVLVRGRSVEPARAVLTAQILSCPGVVALPELTLTLDSAARALAVTFTALVLPPQTGLEDDATPIAISGDGVLSADVVELVCFVEGVGGFL